MAVVAMVSIGILAFSGCKLVGTNFSRFPICSIPLRITMCNISGIVIRGGENLLMMSKILSISYSPNGKGKWR